MMNVYNIIIAKRNKKTPEVQELLRKIFRYTWRLASNKYNETWLCGRADPVVLSDLVDSLKSLNKRIAGVMVQKVNLESVCYDNGGQFDAPSGGETQPSSREVLDVLMHK